MALLVIILTIIFFVSYFINRREYIAPSFGFCASFLFCAIWAYAYEEKWSFDIQTNTFLTITLSVILFTFTTAIVNLFQRNQIKKNKIIKQELVPISINNFKLLIMIVVEIFALFLTVYYIMKITETANFTRAIYLFDNNSKYSPIKYELPRFIGWLRTASLAAGYWFSPVLATNILLKPNKKFPILELIIVLLAMLNYMSTGGRQGAVNIALSVCVCYVILLHKNRNQGYKKLERKFIFFGIIAFIIFLWSFRYVAGLLGRDNSFALWDYLAIYCGGPIKNLDTFLQEGVRNTEFSGAETFYKAYQVIWRLIGENLPNYSTYKIYRRINGYDLGNVYTAFKNYIFDFGLLGNYILVCIYAAISQILYVKAICYKPKNKPALSLILYGLIFNSLILSFFAERFYELFNIISIQWFIIWEFYYVFFTKFKIARISNRSKIKME